MKKYVAEFIGTAVLVLFGTGVAVISGADLVATSLAFGLSIVAMAYVIGSISGCHVNPAVSLAMLLSKKMKVKDFCGYVVAQVLGGLFGTLILFTIFKTAGVETVPALGTNGFGPLNVWGALLVEVVLTFVFVYTILGVTSDDKKSSVAGIVIGLTLAFVHLLGISLTGTSVNPARSLAPAIFAGGTALKELWVFIVAPLVGAAIASLAYKFLNKTK